MIYKCVAKVIRGKNGDICIACDTNPVSPESTDGLCWDCYYENCY